MTRYTVVWVQSVEDELVEIWLTAMRSHPRPMLLIGNLARTLIRRVKILRRACAR